MERKEKIVYVTPSMSSFIRLDLRLLEDRYRVKVIFDDWSNPQIVPWIFVKQFFQLLFTVWTSKVILVSFGGYWSIWPTLFGKLSGKRSMVIIHGTDACNFPEIGYGNLRKPALRLATKWSYQMASRLLPVSESLIYTENNYFDPSNTKKLGVTAEFPSLSTPFSTVANGLDVDFWKGAYKESKDKNLFVTVATDKQFTRKGIDLIVAVAPRFPTSKFIVIGSSRPSDLDLPENIIFTGRLPQEDLIAYFTSAQFYLQLSVFEGFGLSICEAMLCGCVPIGSKVNVLPEIMGEAGFILESRDVNELEKVIKEASSSTDLSKRSKAASQRIAELYPMQKRKEALERLIG